MFLAATEWMIGARREFEGLRVDPCLPSHWERARILRPFRGDLFEIDILNPDRVGSGQLEVEVDGKSSDGNLIRSTEGGKRRQIKVLVRQPKIVSHLSPTQF